MGSGARMERMAFGQTTGEAKAFQAHQLAMIPIMQQQSEMELEVLEKKFAMEIEQTKEMSLLSQQLQPEPILMPAQITSAAGPAEGPGSKNLVYAGLAILVYFLFLRKK